jgi:hypothetical protein
MSLPVLVLMMCLLFTWYFSLLGRTEAAIKVRQQVWSERSGSGGQALAATSLLNPMHGQIKKTMSKSVRGYGGLGGPRDVYSGNVVLAGYWDQRQVSEFNGHGPHFGVMGKMVDPQGAKVDSSIRFHTGILVQIARGILGI